MPSVPLDMLLTMQTLPREDCVQLRLAQPLRKIDGSVLLPAGHRLTEGDLGRLRILGIETLTVLSEDERVPRLPQYLDRFGPDAEFVLERRFAAHKDNPLMQNLLADAVHHARKCREHHRMQS
jgi:hypothetical protein